jgi:hypothetical protein
MPKNVSLSLYRTICFSENDGYRILKAAKAGRGKRDNAKLKAAD